MRLRVVGSALAHRNDVWSGLPIGQHMQDVLLEERRRYNAGGDAEMNARRFPSYEVRMGTDRVYGTILEAHAAGMVMGREVLIRQENAEEWHRVGVTGAPRIYLQQAPPTLLGPIPGVQLRVPQGPASAGLPY